MSATTTPATTLTAEISRLIADPACGAPDFTSTEQAFEWVRGRLVEHAIFAESFESMARDRAIRQALFPERFVSAPTEEERQLMLKDYAARSGVARFMVTLLERDGLPPEVLERVELAIADAKARAATSEWSGGCACTDPNEDFG